MALAELEIEQLVEDVLNSLPIAVAQEGENKEEQAENKKLAALINDLRTDIDELHAGESP